LELRRTLFIRTRGVEHAEDRVDRERVTLRRLDGSRRWTVARAEPILQERFAGGGGPTSPIGAAESMLRTAPYLNERVVARVGGGAEHVRGKMYDREAVRAYAERYWNDPNPDFIHFDVDCTNYVS